ncbi:MAG: hypothetical protein ABIH08_00230 [Candidatus Omnitrophota bacterium]
MKYPASLKALITTALSLLFLTSTYFSLNAQGLEPPAIPCDFIGYESRPEGLIVGDCVSAADGQGNNLGEFIVDTNGEFGFLTIPADNLQTPSKDGALEGETIYFYINGVEQEAVSAWIQAGLKRVDIGTPKIPLTIEITSPQENSAVSSNPVTITGKVNNSQAEVEITLNSTDVWTPAVNSEGIFSLVDVTLDDGTNIIEASAQGPARNTANIQINAYLGWVLHLKDMPWYEKEKNHYSGSAVCKMILDYLRQEDITNGKTQDELYNYGYPFNLSDNDTLLEMDPKAIDAVLGHFDKYDVSGDRYDDGDPYHGYNFDVAIFDPIVNFQAFTEYLRDIIHWIAYPVTIDPWWLDGGIVPVPNSPAAVPIYGSYNHWVAVQGAVTSADPTPQPHTNPGWTPEFTVYGFWLSDPTQNGLGKDVYITAANIGNTYFLPLQTTDEYQGKYLQVAEPPPVENKAKIEIAPEKVNNSRLSLIKIAQDIENLNKIDSQELNAFEQRTQSLKPHLYDSARVVNLNQTNSILSSDLDLNCLFKTMLSDKQEISWQEIISPEALTDPDFKQAIENSIAREFIKVKREDNLNSYYIIPFDKYLKGQFLTYAAIIINAQTGAFQQASWVPEPIKFVPVNEPKAISLVLDYCQIQKNIVAEKGIKSYLTWKPQSLSSSPFFPYWKVVINNSVFYVTQDSKVWEQ